jgi:hypothetical protein
MTNKIKLAILKNKFEESDLNFSLLAPKLIKKNYLTSRYHRNPHFRKLDAEFKKWFPQYDGYSFTKLENILKSQIVEDKKFKEIVAQGHSAWKWLRKNEEYKRDYSQLIKIKLISEKIKNDATIKWGFFPLDCPQNKNASFDFLTQFMNFRPPEVHLANIKINKNKSGYYPKQGLKNSTLTFEINLRMPKGIIAQEIEEIIDRIKLTNKIDTIEPRYSDLATLYMKCIKEKLVHGRNEIKKAIRKTHPTSREEKAAESKRVSRILKKFVDTSFHN